MDKTCNYQFLNFEYNLQFTDSSDNQTLDLDSSDNQTLDLDSSDNQTLDFKDIVRSKMMFYMLTSIAEKGLKPNHSYHKTKYQITKS